MLAIIVTMTGRSICSTSSYCNNNDNNGEGLYVVLSISVTITGRSMSSVSSYCDNDGEVYM